MGHVSFSQQSSVEVVSPVMEVGHSGPVLVFNGLALVRTVAAVETFDGVVPVLGVDCCVFVNVVCHCLADQI